MTWSESIMDADTASTHLASHLILTSEDPATFRSLHDFNRYMSACIFLWRPMLLHIRIGDTRPHT